MRATAKTYQNRWGRGELKNYNERLRYNLSSAPEKLWLCVIIRAVADLNKVKFKDSAYKFLSGSSGSLKSICRCIGLMDYYHGITSTLKNQGVERFKEALRPLIKENIHNATE